MQIIELYINDTKVDLFEDESVSITDSIQNVRDISKIFVPFSQQFNLPASKTNNKLFKHYYNYDIDNGFDARYKADAVIKLNGVDYKKGRIRLNEVSLKDNAPYSYKVVFFGDTLELKEKLAEKKLKDLSFDEDLDFVYNATNVYSKLTTTSAADIVVPLITHSKRFEIHTDDKYRDSDNNDLDYLDLKPAIKVKKIIDAIEAETDLGITFSNDFFNSEEFNNLYLWLHRNEGFISNADEGGGIKTVINRIHLDTTENSWVYDGADPQSDQDLRPLDFSNATDGFTNKYKFTWDITTASTDPYTVIVSDPNGIVLEEEFSGGNDQTIVWESEPIFVPQGGLTTLPNPLNYLCKVQSTNTFTMTQELKVELQYQFIWGGAGYTTELTAIYGATTDDVENRFYVAENMPEIKVYDFLINLFKMFNLTAYKDNGIIKVQTLNDYYNDGKRYDITDYVDASKSSVSKLLQYKNIIFNFKSKVSQLVQFSDELQGIPFSEESYGDDAWDGGDYKVEIDFEKMMYERLYEADGTTLTPICQGTMIDKKGEATIGKPLLLYCVNTDPDDYIHLQSGGGTPTNYKRPSQIYENEDNRTALNFGLERDEFFQEIVGTNLFFNYYKDYVVSLFNLKGRKVKLSAYLPLHIILNYNLNDIFIISGKGYRINTIKTNLLTNKSDLELITNLQTLSEIQNTINPNAPRVAQPTVTTKDTSSITLSWDAVSGVTGYKLYVDDLYDQTVLGTGHKFSGLESGITYKLGVQASYTNFDAPITNTIETTN